MVVRFSFKQNQNTHMLAIDKKLRPVKSQPAPPSTPKLSYNHRIFQVNKMQGREEFRSSLGSFGIRIVTLLSATTRNVLVSLSFNGCFVVLLHLDAGA